MAPDYGSSRDRWFSRVTPYVLGALVSLALFVYVIWGLSYFWGPATPHKPPSRWTRILRDTGWVFVLSDLAFKVRVARKKRKPSPDYWPGRPSVPPGPALENAGAIQSHPGEASEKL